MCIGSNHVWTWSSSTTNDNAVTPADLRCGCGEFTRAGASESAAHIVALRAENAQLREQLGTIRSCACCYPVCEQWTDSSPSPSGLPKPAAWAQGEVAPRFRHLIPPRQTPLKPKAPDPPGDDRDMVPDSIDPPFRPRTTVRVTLRKRGRLQPPEAKDTP